MCDSLTEQIAALDFLRNNSDLDSLIPADELLSLKSLNIEESVAAATKLRTELEATYRLLGVHSVISDFESNLEVLSNAGKTPSGTFFDASEFLGAGKKLDESSRQQRAFLIDASKKSRPFSNEFRVELVDVYMAFDINVAEVNKTVAKCTANAKTQRDYVNYMARNPDLGPIS